FAYPPLFRSQPNGGLPFSASPLEKEDRYLPPFLGTAEELHIGPGTLSIQRSQKTDHFLLAGEALLAGGEGGGFKAHVGIGIKLKHLLRLRVLLPVIGRVRSRIKGGKQESHRQQNGGKNHNPLFQPNHNSPPNPPIHFKSTLKI